MDKSQKDLVDRGLMLPLMEAFYTIQGEGYHKQYRYLDIYLYQI